MSGKIWSVLLHLGGNMWNEEGNIRGRESCPDAVASQKLRFSRPVWDRYLKRLAGMGVNMIVLDIGEGLRYESHPELAVEGSWSREDLVRELGAMRAMGFEVIPKLNFSACHDVWLRDYARMLSTPVYYEVVSDLIREVSEIFRPRFFHLGMDEETAGHQRDYDYCVIRQHDLWWHDFYYMTSCVEREGARAWIWSDYIWGHRDEFLAKMPKSVVQSNWYYTPRFEDEDLNDRIGLGSFMEGYVMEGFTASKTPEECIHNVYYYSDLLKPYLNFCLCLKKNWKNMDDELYVGYPDTMGIYVARSMAGGASFYGENKALSFPTEKMLPGLGEADGKPSVYYFSPVHFDGVLLGYAVLQRELCTHPVINVVYRNWLRCGI